MSKTHIVVVLDRSGSMTSCAEATVTGFDEFVNKQKREDGEATLTLVQFDDEYEVVYNDKDIQDVASISDIYAPRGMTALLDAIGKTIATTNESMLMKSKKQMPDKIMCIIITDGHENASKEYAKPQIVETIQKLEQGDWEFVFLGASIDAVHVATSLGMKGSSAATYDTGKMGSSFDVLSAKCGTYRSMNSLEVQALADGSEALFSDEDREELV